MFVLGHDGYYFLTNDSNDVLAQTQGKLKLSSDFLREVAHRHEERISFAGSIGAMYFHIVAPNKETVFNHLLPRHVVFERNGPIPLRRYLKSKRQVRRFTHYRPEILRGSAHLAPTYPRTDTHWTTYGAMAYLRDFAHRFGVDPLVQGFDTLRIVISHSSVKGDLAYHADLPEESYASASVDHAGTSFHFEGNLVNEGHIIHARSSNPAARGRVLVIHDSFAYVFLPVLTHSFEEVLSIHSPDMDFGFARAFAPNYILFVQAERFFPRVLRNDIILTERLAHFAAAKQRPDVASPHIKRIIDAPNPISRGPIDIQRPTAGWLQRLGFLRGGGRSPGDV